MTGCAPADDPASNADPGVDFARFQTFGFMQPLSTDARLPVVHLAGPDGRGERELVALGLKRTDANPDLLVNCSANLDQRLRVTQTPHTNAPTFGTHRRGFYSTWPSYRTEVRQYTKAPWLLTSWMRPGCSSCGRAWPRTG